MPGLGLGLRLVDGIIDLMMQTPLAALTDNAVRLLLQALQGV